MPTKTPADIDPQSGFRLPLPKRETLDPESLALFERLQSPGHGSIVGIRGPAGVRLHSPTNSRLAQPLNRYLRFEAAYGARTREIAILTTAREFDSQFEWAAHEPESLKEGVPAAIVDIIKHRKSTAGLAEHDAVVIELGRELMRTHRLSSALFARALKEFGARDLVDIICLMGNYAGTAMLLAAFDMQLPEGQEPLLPVS